MLPSRSKRYVANLGNNSRIQLVSSFELVVIVVAMLVLMTLIFPHRTLVNQLVQLEVLDEVSLNYLENIVRLDNTNIDLILALAKAKTGHLNEPEMVELLNKVDQNGDKSQRGIAALLRFNANKVSMSRTEISAVLLNLSTFDLPLNDVVFLANYAMQLGEEKLALEFYRSMDAMAPGKYPNWLQRSAQYSLGNKRYRQAADYYFYARVKAQDPEYARRMFKAGVNVLMADSRYREAIEDAQRFLGDLEQDQEIIRFMVSIARSAGDSHAAAHYAHALVQSLQEASE